MKCRVCFPFFIIAAVIACRMIDLDIPTTHDATYFPSRSFDRFFTSSCGFDILHPSLHLDTRPLFSRLIIPSCNYALTLPFEKKSSSARSNMGSLYSFLQDTTLVLSSQRERRPFDFFPLLLSCCVLLQTKRIVLFYRFSNDGN